MTNDLTAMEAWRKRLAAAGFKPLADPWSPAPKETPLPPPAVKQGGKR